MSNESWRVPNTERVRVMHSKLLPSGKYKGTIVEIREPRRSHTRDGQFNMCIVLQVEGQQMYHWVGGYMSVILMVYKSREYWIGQEVSVRIGIREWQEQYHNTVDIAWGVVNAGKSDTN